MDDPDRVKTVLREHRSKDLSICSAGELTLCPDDVTKLLSIIQEEQIDYERIKLYTNGIRIGEEPEFQNTLSEWRELGLTDIYLTVHSFNRQENARLYGVKSYPSVPHVIGVIHAEGFDLRINLVLVRGRVDTAARLKSFVKKAMSYGVDRVTAWPERGQGDIPRQDIPASDLEEMAALSKSLPVCVYWPPREATDKLCLFPDGELRDSWCK
jgi:uncharacterized radical SAM superfamily Fe-S cluster-containing enzyme